ncbi:uncharacterized protein PV06_11486 [Exophiala oligosperma]|uniref:Cutinase n=1 Tax=Exophiala oligosperma TaxID=215243 RepID=A0A0D2DKG5_9EURO|nr:uncharacterized protein PV06_11486 [Exophiala oligosperma]KIW36239.1 hypothetical protein PV06_11486 [Exophiala oligosperma]
MRGVFVPVIGALAATATAASSNTTCAEGLYILCARGSGEPAVAPKAGTYPDNTGSPGVLALQVAQQIKGTIIAGVIYPATDPTATGALNLTAYELSENTGAKSIVEEVNQYHSACPDSKIALIGYSQGAQVIQDALCGGTGGDFNSDAPLSPDLVEKNVIAIALIADPTHIANTTYDHGTGVHDGVFPRKNTTVCNQYSGLMGSWCGRGDRYCDSGNNDTIHNLAPLTYDTDVVQFVVEKWQNSTSQGGSGSTAIGTASSSTMAGSTGSPTNTASGSANSAAGAPRSGRLLTLLGTGVLLALWSLH